MKKSVEMMVKSICTRIAGMEMRISHDIPKRWLQKVPEINRFSKQRSWSWSGRLEQTFGLGIAIGDRECVISMDPLSPARIKKVNFKFVVSSFLYVTSTFSVTLQVSDFIFTADSRLQTS